MRGDLLRVPGALFRFFRALIEQLIMNLPSDGLSSRLRHLYLRRKLAPGSGVFYSMTGLSIADPRNVLIKDGVSINRGVIIDASGGEIEIGKDTLIGPYSVIRAANHKYEKTDRSIKKQGHQGGRIVIEDDCWLASVVVVTTGVRIGRGSVIGAHSVVTKDLPPYSVAFGVPAKVARSRVESEKMKHKDDRGAKRQ